MKRERAEDHGENTQQHTLIIWEGREITRLQAVQSQLETAVKAYFLWDDIASVMTLTGAAERVLSDLQPEGGILGVDAFSIRAGINLLVKPEHQKNASKLMRGAYDCLRHADKNPSQVYNLQEDFLLYYMILTFAAWEFLGNTQTPLMQICSLWIYAKRPEWLKKDSPHYDFILRLQSGIENLSKKEYFLLSCDARKIQIIPPLSF